MLACIKYTEKAKMISQLAKYLILLVMLMAALAFNAWVCIVLASFLQPYIEHNFYVSFAIIAALNYFAAYMVFVGAYQIYRERKDD